MTYQPEGQTVNNAASSPIRNDAPNNAAAAHDSRFDCNICLEPVTEPVVSRCGHLYCWPCLYRWLQPGMTEQERYDMGWGGFDAGGGTGSNGAYFGSASLSGGRGSSARRCCPVCKTECSVRDVVPIYVRESNGNNDGAPVVGSTDDVDEIDDSAPATATHQHSPVDTAAEATSITDPTTLTGLRRRRGGGTNTANGGGEASAMAGALAAENDGSNDDDLSISTISTNDHSNTATNATNAAASDSTNATANRAEATAHAEIPSRPIPQPYLHQRSAGEDSTGMRPSDPTEAPRTPLINNRQQRQGSTAGGGIRRPPISPPRGARPSSLSNGLSLTVWSGFVDALLGAQTNAAGGGNNGTGAASADGGYVPPIHRPDNGRGPGRGDAAVSGSIGGGGTGHDRNEDGAFNGSSPTAAETTRGRRWFNPTTFVEDSTTEFLSRLLLMLGCFVVFCLLLF